MHSTAEQNIQEQLSSKVNFDGDGERVKCISTSVPQRLSGECEWRGLKVKRRQLGRWTSNQKCLIMASGRQAFRQCCNRIHLVRKYYDEREHIMQMCVHIEKGKMRKRENLALHRARAASAPPALRTSQSVSHPTIHSILAIHFASGPCTHSPGLHTRPLNQS